MGNDSTENGSVEGGSQGGSFVLSLPLGAEVFSRKPGQEGLKSKRKSATAMQGEGDRRLEIK